MYKLGLKTKMFDYYINENEDDENKSVIMKDKEGEIISDNYFAYASFFDDLKLAINNEDSYDFIDEDTLKNGIEYFKKYDE